MIARYRYNHVRAFGAGLVELFFVQVLFTTRVNDITQVVAETECVRFAFSILTLLDHHVCYILTIIRLSIMPTVVVGAGIANTVKAHLSS